MTLADMCRGCAGVHMSGWCVHEVREVQAACVVSLLGVDHVVREDDMSSTCTAVPVLSIDTHRAHGQANSSSSSIGLWTSVGRAAAGAAPRP